VKIQALYNSTLRFYRFIRPYLGLGFKAIQILFSEGFGALWHRYKQYIKDKKHYQAIIKNNVDSGSPVVASNSMIQTLEKPLEDFMEARLSCFLNQFDNKLILPEYAEPIVSIITPVFNKASYTFQYLESLLAHTRMPYELIIINNGSTDETNHLLNRTTNIIHINNQDNLGFIKACNQGANIAKGKYLLFANSDVIVTPGWLSNLVKTIENDNKCGAVGCKLILPDGKLQEAGSIIWSDGTATGYGRGDDPMNPSYSYLREVDYCSGACLLVSKTIFHQLNGFNEIYWPAYYEDTDLCLGIRNLGYKIIYQPDVIVFHHEYASGGYQNASSLMEANHFKFLAKWENMLKDKLAFSSSNILYARDLRKTKRILVIDDRVPTPDQGTGYPRSYQMIKSIAEFGYKVTLFPLMNTEAWQPYTHEFQQLGIEVFHGNNLDLNEFARERPGYYDLVLVSRPHNMASSINIIKEHFASAPILYDAEALFSLREILKAEIKGNKLKDSEAQSMIDMEIKLMKQADVIITVSDNERDTVLKHGIKHVVSWGHPTNIMAASNGFDDRRDILFIGAFMSDDSPNEDAVVYFIKEIFPQIYKQIPCRFIIVGKNPPDCIKELEDANIIVTGYVNDLTEYYEKCRVFVVPHRYSGGIPLKLTEAMSRGIPSVVSRLTAAQLNLTDGVETLIGTSEIEFAQKVIELYQDKQLWQRIQANALDYIAKTCDPSTLKLTLKNIFELADKGNFTY
jgi:GT2 family glycosyltransferase